MSSRPSLRRTHFQSVHGFNGDCVPVRRGRNWKTPTVEYDLTAMLLVPLSSDLRQIPFQISASPVRGSQGRMSVQNRLLTVETGFRKAVSGPFFALLRESNLQKAAENFAFFQIATRLVQKSVILCTAYYAAFESRVSDGRIDLIMRCVEKMDMHNASNPPPAPDFAASGST
jgi:hypothetical protein